MLISALPTKILARIVDYAWMYRLSGLKHILRLRFVDRKWSDAVEHALFASDILENSHCRGLVDSVLKEQGAKYPTRAEPAIGLWKRYWLYRAYHDRKPVPVRLRYIREVAEYVITAREETFDERTAVRLAKRMFSQMSPLLIIDTGSIGRVGLYDKTDEPWDSRNPHLQQRSTDSYNEDEPRLATYFDREATRFNRYLLEATAYVNEEMITGAMELAIRQGNTEYMQILARQYRYDPVELSKTFPHAMLWAAEEGRLEAFGIVNGWERARFGPYIAAVRGPAWIISLLERTTDLRIFERLVYLKSPRLLEDDGFSIGRHFCRAAARGALPLMEYLSGLGVDLEETFEGILRVGTNLPVAWLNGGFRAIDIAAWHGHYDVVLFLLDSGAMVNKALFAASHWGSPALVCLMLDEYSYYYFHLQASFWTAAMNENELVFRLLLESGTGSLHKTTLGRIRACAKVEGVDSAIRLMDSLL
ncbi:hypothetical protein F4780DRAFT_780302 [Xylariomycetidae sp. FL0641]|nr:hypothetical protein F4780DRAFT_780302 [Xylariomycetidae sp. FL0641]